MKKFFKEFKEFISKGDVLDLAVGVIIGAAFKDIVTALTNSFINPLIQLCTGSSETNVGGQFTVNGAVFDYGTFITAIVNFIIMAFVVFCFVKAVRGMQDLGKKVNGKISKKKEEPAAPTTKICPFCKSEINIEATRCPHCTSELPEEK